MVNYTLNLLPIASDNQPVKRSRHVDPTSLRADLDEEKFSIDEVSSRFQTTLYTLLPCFRFFLAWAEHWGYMITKKKKVYAYEQGV